MSSLHLGIFAWLLDATSLQWERSLSIAGFEPSYMLLYFFLVHLYHWANRFAIIDFIALILPGYITRFIAW